MSHVETNDRDTKPDIAPDESPPEGTRWVWCWSSDRERRRGDGWRWWAIDTGVADIVEALQGRLPTIASCHGHRPGEPASVWLGDGRILLVLENEEDYAFVEETMRGRAALGLVLVPTRDDPTPPAPDRSELPSGCLWYAATPDSIETYRSAEEARDVAADCLEPDGEWHPNIEEVGWGLLVPLEEAEEYDRKAVASRDWDEEVSYRLAPTGAIASLTAPAEARAQQAEQEARDARQHHATMAEAWERAREALIKAAQEEAQAARQAGYEEGRREEREAVFAYLDNAGHDDIDRARRVAAVRIRRGEHLLAPEPALRLRSLDTWEPTEAAPKGGTPEPVQAAEPEPCKHPVERLLVDVAAWRMRCACGALLGDGPLPPDFHVRAWARAMLPPEPGDPRRSPNELGVTRCDHCPAVCRTRGGVCLFPGGAHAVPADLGEAGGCWEPPVEEGPGHA